MIEALVLPPGILIVLSVLGLALLPVRQRLAMGLIGVSVLVLYLLSAPLVSYLLIDGLQNQYPPITTERWEAHRPDAIVVLGAGRLPDPPEYDSDQPSGHALLRLRYAAQLYREHDTPVLVSGGSPQGEPAPEAALMARMLQDDFQVPVRWIEDASHTTWDNAVESDTILAGDGIVRVAVVTQAWHMPRAIWSFRAVGLDPLPAPTAFEKPSPRDGGLSGLLPRYYGFQLSALALREHLGLTWYRMRMGGWRPAAVSAP